MTPPAGPTGHSHGWALFAHPLFMTQLQALTAQVEAQRRHDPAGYTRKNAAKRLAALHRLCWQDIPQDPARPEYRQGNTLGEAHRHWRRARFFQQYRLFFRYHAGARLIVYAWVNDDSTRRAYDSPTDAYRVFGRMLASGRPPADWEGLVAEAEGLPEAGREWGG